MHWFQAMVTWYLLSSIAVEYVLTWLQATIVQEL